MSNSVSISVHEYSWLHNLWNILCKEVYGKSLTMESPRCPYSFNVLAGSVSDSYRGGRRLSSNQRCVFTARILKVGVLSPVELKHSAIRSNTTQKTKNKILYGTPLNSFQSTTETQSKSTELPSPSLFNTENEAQSFRFRRHHSWSNSCIPDH